MQKPKPEGGLIRKACRRYFVDAMSAMALGLFSSLIIGLILAQLSNVPFLSWLQPFAQIVNSGSPVVGAAIGIAIAYGLKTKPLVMFASSVTGAIGYHFGGPVGAYIAAIAGAEVGSLIAGRTPVDIVLVPALTIVAGGLAGSFVGPAIGALMTGLGEFINEATNLLPIPMGVVVSTVMGMILTAPISSAAISISLGLEGLAAGAACVGCSTQMIGFAVASYRENKVAGLLSQGLGTSMLQFGNILKRPAIWLPPTIASAILGPISTSVFKMTNNSMGAGMGTSGLVGQFGAWVSMQPSMPPLEILGLIALMHFIFPAVLVLLISEFLRKIGWIRPGDMQLTLK